MTEQAITTGSMLGSLSGSALLGVIVLVLGYAVHHLYKQQSQIVGEKQDKQIQGLETIKKQLDESITVNKANLQAYKENNKLMTDFLQEHCKQNTEKLGEIDKKIDVLSGVGDWLKDIDKANAKKA